MASLHLKLANRVRKGAAKLDRYFGGRHWRKEIDKVKLNMNSCFDCILGQLFANKFTDESGFSIGMDKMKLHNEIAACGLDISDADWEQDNFDLEHRRKFWDVLTSQWINIISKA